MEILDKKEQKLKVEKWKKTRFKSKQQYYSMKLTQREKV